MKKLYDKSPLWFALSWIIVYVVGTSIADGLSETIGIEKSITLVLHIVLSTLALVWLKKNGLYREFGLCKSDVPASKFLYYIPLIIMVSCNLWFGVTLNLSVHETCLYVCSMICVGFLEELIFRGFLFKAMAKDNIKAAIIVSSITFGIGHIVNLLNGSGAELIPNLCQVCYATAFGFLCVIIFYRGKSLLPCIVAHSVMNALSAFSNEANRSQSADIMVSIVLCVIPLIYIGVLLKILPRETK